MVGTFSYFWYPGVMDAYFYTCMLFWFQIRLPWEGTGDVCRKDYGSGRWHVWHLYVHRYRHPVLTHSGSLHSNGHIQNASIIAPQTDFICCFHPIEQSKRFPLLFNSIPECVRRGWTQLSCFMGRLAFSIMEFGPWIVWTVLTSYTEACFWQFVPGMCE